MSTTDLAPAPAWPARLLPAVATVFGLGYVRPGPGTWASVATGAGVMLAGDLPAWGWALAAAVVTLVGTLAVRAYCRTADGHDPPEVVIDEVAGTVTAVAAFTLLLGPGLTFAQVALVVGLFRALDIGKPWPIRWVDDHVHTPFGAMLDDVLAGLAAGLVAAAALTATRG